MDPDATWLQLCATLSDLGEHADDQERREQAIELLNALATWLQRGGFPPTVAHER